MSATKAKGNRYNAVTPWFSIVMMVLTGSILMFVFYESVYTFRANDNSPPIISLTPQKLIEFGGIPAPVDVGMYIRDFPEFDIVKGKFVVDITIWFRFNPQLVSLDRISKFMFEKAEIIKNISFKDFKRL